MLRRTYDNGFSAECRITETEAYSQDDPASHTYGGQTERNKPMYGPGGRAYIYQSYGLHLCLNCVAGPAGEGRGVLIRGAFALKGRELMIQRRDAVSWPEDRIRRALLNGPGKIGQALELSLDLNGHDLSEPPLQILDDGLIPPNEKIAVTPRIGITKGADRLRRFFWSG